MAPPTALRAKLSRRTLLKSGFVGTCLVTLGGVGLALQKPHLAAPSPGGLTVLSPEEYAVLVALADRLCPAKEPGFPGASALGVAKSIDAFFTNALPDEKEGFKMALRLFDNALSGALFGERLQPFTALPADSQDRVLAAWRDSSVGFRRTVYTGLSGLIQAVYWGDPRSWARVGYPGPLDPEALRKTYAENLVDLNGLRATTQTKGA